MAEIDECPTSTDVETQAAIPPVLAWSEDSPAELQEYRREPRFWRIAQYATMGVLVVLLALLGLSRFPSSTPSGPVTGIGVAPSGSTGAPQSLKDADRPVAPDARFLALLKRDKVALIDGQEQTETGNGHAVCKLLASGTPRDSVRDQLVTNIQGYSNTEANRFIDDAIEVYCP